jgi:dethiobiotin synthetase
MKPFCSGSRKDVNLLQSIQPGKFGDAEVNPFFFRKPIAPLIAARQGRRLVHLAEVLDAIEKVASRGELLLVEGAGGLLTPLGEQFTAVEVIRDLKAHVCIVAANKLGVINHTCLTTQALAPFAKKSMTVVLTRTTRTGDASTASNRAIIAELLSPRPVLSLPYLGSRASSLRTIAQNSRRTARTWKALFESLHS